MKRKSGRSQLGLGKIILWVFLLSLLVVLLPFLGAIGLAASTYFALFQKNWKRAGAVLVAALCCFALTGLVSNSQTTSGKNKDWNQSNLVSSSSKPESSSTDSTSTATSSSQLNTSSSSINKEESQISASQFQSNGLLEFTKKKQLYLAPLDRLGRATLGHIQLRDADEPVNKRNNRISYNPVGWHNFKFPFGDGTKEAWLMNRGHLVGYQFSGLEEDGKNLVPMTAWLNSGNYAGMDSGNEEGILYYENLLDGWLANHPNYWLDYQVKAIYQGDELIPRQVELQYVGIDQEGQLLQISLGGDKESVDAYGITKVALENQSPNATINYVDGKAQGLVAKAQVVENQKTVPSQPSSSLEAQAPAQDPNRIVYVASHGTSDAYWYYKESMPSTTKLENVVEMKEADAISLGKHHSLNE